MKELIKTIALVIAIVAVAYFFFEFEKVNMQMNALMEADSTHKVTINDFDHSLNDLDLEFKGRGKHIQQFQKSLEHLSAKMDSINLALTEQIEGTNTSIAELKMDIDSRFSSMKSDQDEINDRLNKFQRETSRTLTDLQSALTRMSREFSDLDKRVKNLETPSAPTKK